MSTNKYARTTEGNEKFAGVARNEPVRDETERTAARDDPSLLEKQTRTRRLFSTSQLFAFSFVFFITWPSLGSNMYYSLLNGGPIAYVFNFIPVFIGVLAQAACLAELSSVLPVAGAQYYWTFAFAPPRIRLFITWMQGWATWFGYIATLAAIFNATIVNLEATIQIASPAYENGGWHTTLLIIALLTLYTVINLWFFVVVPWFEIACGVLNVIFFLITFIALWALSPRNDASIMLTRTNYGGWDNEFISWHVGIITHTFLFVGFESVVHMGEEAKNPCRATPIAMFWSIVANGVLGIFMIFTYMICMPPIEDMMATFNPFIYLLKTATGDSIGTLLATGVVTMSLSCCMTILASTSRLTWAWARDGALPAYFSLVDAKTRVPMRAILFTAFLVSLLALLNINAASYIALGAITSLSSLSIYFSYVIILSVILYMRLTSGFEMTPKWSMGRLGLPVNVFALIYTVYTMIWLPFPQVLPVTPQNMNYSGPVFLAVMLGAMGGWVVWARKHWLGPNKAVADLVLRKTSDLE